MITPAQRQFLTALAAQKQGRTGYDPLRYEGLDQPGTTPLAPLDVTSPSPESYEEAARWLCKFAELDPDDVIADGGQMVWQWVAYYDVPMLLALLPSLAQVVPCHVCGKPIARGGACDPCAGRGPSPDLKPADGALERHDGTAAESNGLTNKDTSQ